MSPEDQAVIDALVAAGLPTDTATLEALRDEIDVQLANTEGGSDDATDAEANDS